VVKELVNSLACICRDCELLARMLEDSLTLQLGVRELLNAVVHSVKSYLFVE